MTQIDSQETLVENTATGILRYFIDSHVNVLPLKTLYLRHCVISSSNRIPTDVFRGALNRLIASGRVREEYSDGGLTAHVRLLRAIPVASSAGDHSRDRAGSE